MLLLKKLNLHQMYLNFLLELDHLHHPLQPWPADTPLDTEAQMCGVCRERVSILAYINGPDPPACPNPRCRAPMNPGCKLHWPLYFSRELIAKAQAAGSPKPPPQTAGSPRKL